MGTISAIELVVFFTIDIINLYEQRRGNTTT
jgi:hypothetical protein